MSNPSPPNHDARIGWFLAELGVHTPNLTIQPILHQEAMVAMVYRISTPKQTMILKCCHCPQAYHYERHCLTQLPSLLPVPLLLDALPPHRDHHGCLLMQHCPGDVLQPSQLTPKLAECLGESMAMIHAQRYPYFGALSKTKRSSNANALSQLQQKFLEELAECSDHLSPSLINKTRRYFDDESHKLREVDGPCLVHGDFRPGNLLTNSNQLTAIIDWASAKSGFAEMDLAMIESQPWQSLTPHRHAFITGYTHVRTLPHYQPLLPLLHMCEAVRVIGFTIKHGSWKNQHAALYQRHHQILHNLLHHHRCWR